VSKESASASSTAEPDDLTVQHVTLPIDTEVEIDDARRALGLRRIALEAR
jgi:hypothetical protein